jgi:iron complex transport system substrate-binding protein
MADSMLRIISLIPSATEIVAALGLTNYLVGRSHECDYPPEISNLPICTQPKFNPQGTSQQIHDRVTELLQSALSVYQVEIEQLEQLQPTHILTQAQCEVCAVSLSDVEQAVAKLTKSKPKVVSLQPSVLAEVWTDIQQVADALGVNGHAVVESLQARVERCWQQTQAIAARPSVVCIEWAEPLMVAGNWVPELVSLAGGKNLLGVTGQHSPKLDWVSLLEVDPDVIILMPCGFDLNRTRQDALQLAQHSNWQSLRAVQAGKVYITDGNQYFNRPGPRLVDSLEILAEILCPKLHFGYEGTGWERLPADAVKATA